jgi:hypothetical protein
VDLWQPVASHHRHGTLYAVLDTFQQAEVVPDPATAAYLTGETGVVTLAAVVLVAAVLARRYSRAGKPTASGDRQQPAGTRDLPM